MSEEMTLLHHTAEPLVFDRDRVYDQTKRDDKPDGFWVSVEGEQDWREWCESEQWGLDRLAVDNVVTLRDDANILYVETVEDLIHLDKRFGVSAGSVSLSRNYGMAWGSILRQYDGIIIAPYQWSVRTDIMWYYGWDCASGCIWNLRAIDDVTVRPRYEEVPIIPGGYTQTIQEVPRG